MEAIFLFFSFACLIYFVIIVIYSGIGTSFCGIWLFFAAASGLMAYFCARTPMNRERLPRRLPVAVFTTFFAGVAAFLCLMIPVMRAARVPAEQGLPYVVVLGAKVEQDGLSTSLRKRLETACAYHKENPETIFILSGGKGKDEPVPEALAMYNYLYEQGVPARNMRIEMFSESTVENIRYSLAQIDVEMEMRYRGKDPDRIPIGILSSDFHIFRAMKIAETEGCSEPRPIAAPSDSILFLHLCVRECAAILKDHILGNISLL